MKRFDYECTNGHLMTLWEDDPRMCGACGSEFLKRVFLEPPMINTPKSKMVDQMVRRELENRGITNIKSDGHEGESAKVTYKSTPAQLAAAKIEKDFPQMNDPNGVEIARQQIINRWSSIGVKGVIKSGIGSTPEVAGVKSILMDAKNHDRDMVRRIPIKDPQNLQVKR